MTFPANDLLGFIRELYETKDFIPLHEPRFAGNEKAYLNNTIDSTFVSSVGQYVDRFELAMTDYTGSPHAIACVNGTTALHMALKLAGVAQGDRVITQALTFVATCNAIAYCGAEPAFVDVAQTTLGMCPQALSAFLEQHAYIDDLGHCRCRQDNRRFAACLPMHTFGHPVDLNGLLEVCGQWHIPLVEDAAESLGSLYQGRHTGTFGITAALSFNGNKIITTGGGGMVLTNQQPLHARGKHLTTTAKVPHAYEYVHDEIGYNYRLPNLNAALGCAQMEQLAGFVDAKRALAQRYQTWLADTALADTLQFVAEPPACRSNYWLNALLCPDRTTLESLLQQTNAAGIMTRPIWQPMHRLPMYQHCMRDGLSTTDWLAERLLNLPSSVLQGTTNR